jgi:hypothetical protein
LPEDLESIIDKGEAFTLKKHDRTATVGVLDGRIFGLGQDLLVKRFNYRGIADFALRRFFSGRASRLWDINQRLFAKGLPVPRPIGYLETSLGRKNSFFISALVENSSNLADVHLQGLFREPQRLGAILGKTLAAWHMAGAVHGDLKWSNIMLQRNDELLNIFFVDLDQAKLYSSPKIKGIIKDLVRFCRYGLELGAEEWVRSDFFPAYCDMLPGQIKAEIDLFYIQNKAKKEWERKGRRRL